MSQKWEPTPRASKTPTLRPFDGEIVELPDADVEFFRAVYEIYTPFSTRYIKLNPHSQRYVLPILSPEGKLRGHVLRQPWKGAPQKRLLFYPKADTYMSTFEPVQSFYGGWDAPLIMVEDQLSAIKLYALGYRSVAVLGTPYANDPFGFQQGDRVAELAREAGDKGLIVALDSDATESAFMFAKKWGYAFKKIRVAILDKDLKDTPAGEFGRVLNV
jgi:hypothetical protein